MSYRTDINDYLGRMADAAAKLDKILAKMPTPTSSFLMVDDGPACLIAYWQLTIDEDGRSPEVQIHMEVRRSGSVQVWGDEGGWSRYGGSGLYGVSSWEKRAEASPRNFALNEMKKIRKRIESTWKERKKPEPEWRELTWPKVKA